MIGLAVAAALPLGAQIGDEFDDLRTRWKAAIAGWNLDLTDPAVAARGRSLDASARNVWNSMDKSAARMALFPDLASTTVSSHIPSSYNRLRTMPLALETPGATLFDDERLALDLISALDWMYANRYNEIGGLFHA